MEDRLLINRVISSMLEYTSDKWEVLVLTLSCFMKTLTWYENSDKQSYVKLKFQETYNMTEKEVFKKEPPVKKKYTSVQGMRLNWLKHLVLNVETQAQIQILHLI